MFYGGIEPDNPYYVYDSWSVKDTGDTLKCPF